MAKPIEQICQETVADLNQQIATLQTREFDPAETSQIIINCITNALSQVASNDQVNLTQQLALLLHADKIASSTETYAIYLTDHGAETIAQLYLNQINSEGSQSALYKFVNVMKLMISTSERYSGLLKIIYSLLDGVMNVTLTVIAGMIFIFTATVYFILRTPDLILNWVTNDQLSTNIKTYTNQETVQSEGKKTVLNQIRLFLIMYSLIIESETAKAEEYTSMAEEDIFRRLMSEISTDIEEEIKEDLERRIKQLIKLPIIVYLQLITNTLYNTLDEPLPDHYKLFAILSRTIKGLLFIPLLALAALFKIMEFPIHLIIGLLVNAVIITQVLTTVTLNIPLFLVDACLELWNTVSSFFGIDSGLGQSSYDQMMTSFPVTALQLEQEVVDVEPAPSLRIQTTNQQRTSLTMFSSQTVALTVLENDSGFTMRLGSTTTD